MEPEHPTNTVTSYAHKINAAWRNAFDNVIDTGRLLAEAKCVLGKRAWGEMVDSELVFSRRTANKLIDIVEDERLSSSRYADVLPPHWSTLHALKYLSDEQFEFALTEGLIHPDMMRKDAERLRKQRKTPKRPLPVVASSGSSRDETSEEMQLPDLSVEGVSDDVLAIIRNNDHLSDNEIGQLECELDRLGEQFGISFGFYGYKTVKQAKVSRRKNLAQKMQRWHEIASQKYNKGQCMSASEVRFYEDVIWQLETGNSLPINSDGTYHPTDLRHPKNPYHHALGCKNEPDELFHILEDVYSECDLHHILTRYTPVEYFDYFAYLNILVFQHCVADKKRRAEIERRLLELEAKEHDIRDGYLAAKRAQEQGIPYKEYAHLMPATCTDFRDMDLDKSVDIEPGYARAAYEMLIR
ncbi:MAG: DUF3102 domain-containing protein [Alphaproteobacteria bacterium]|nr:MAG: DUF3102 domain-containing protein [Alphaproteobacteria bacterium]